MFRTELSIIKLSETEYRFDGFRELLNFKDEYVEVDGKRYSRPANTVDLYDYTDVFNRGGMKKFELTIFGIDYVFYYYIKSDFAVYNRICIQSEYGNMLYCVFTHLGYDAIWSRANGYCDLNCDIEINSFTYCTGYGSGSCFLYVNLPYQELLKKNLLSYVGPTYKKFHHNPNMCIFDEPSNETQMVDRLVKFTEIRCALLQARELDENN